MPAPADRTDLHRLLAQLAIGSDAILVVASLFIPEDALSRANWDAEDARRYQQAAFKLHELAHEANDASQPEAAKKLDDDLAAAKNEFEKVQAELDAASGGPQRLSLVLRWMGVVLASVGLIAYLAISQREVH